MGQGSADYGILAKSCPQLLFCKSSWNTNTLIIGICCFDTVTAQLSCYNRDCWLRKYKRLYAELHRKSLHNSAVG